MVVLDGSFSKKRILLLALAIVIVSLSFWAGSRYPDLSQKGAAGPNILLDGIGFDSVMLVEPADSTLIKIGKRTVNWLNTNKKGMFFGLVLAALASTLLSQLPKKGFTSVLGSTAFGTVLGAPLGLCVNCAAPIGTGMHQSGSRLETTTAAVLASPSLNVLVLSILFTLLPWHLALAKVLLSLLLILVGVPLLTRGQRKELDAEVELCPLDEGDNSESWLAAAWWSLKSSLATLWQLTWKLGPFMVLAGFLGSALITMLPLNSLASLQSGHGLGLFLAALVGTLLPVPVAFDVVLCGLLYQAGVASSFVAVWLFTLGSFSLYSHIVFHQTISKIVAIRISLTVCLIGFLFGLLTPTLDHHYRDWVDQRLMTALRENLSESSQREELQPQPQKSLAELRPDIKNLEPWISLEETPQYRLEKRELFSSHSEVETLFVRRSGPDLGLEQRIALSFREHMWTPTVTNRSLACGDIHQDGWPDIVVANDTEFGGLSLYANTGGQFERQALEGPEAGVFVLVTAFADINNDGWLDLYWSDILGRNRVLLNEQGEFGKVVDLPSFPGAFVNCVGFADLNQDGRLDMVLGTWVYRFYRTQRFRAWNYVLLQKSDLKFEAQALPGEGGNTQSLLLSDLNQDGKLDLVVGNDWKPVDEYYWGEGDGSFTPFGKETVPLTPEWTMSVDSGDLDNDLRPELFLAHIAYDNDVRTRMGLAREQNQVELLGAEEASILDYMLKTDGLHDKNRLLHVPSSCLNSKSLASGELSDCLFDTVLSRKWRGESRDLWLDMVPQDDLVLRRLFDQVYPVEREQPPKASSFVSMVPSSLDKNVLYRISESGAFIETVKHWGLAYTYWTWNAKFADFNLDGFLDLYVANGSYQEELLTPNLLYLNKQGKGMRLVTDQGADDHFPTSNTAYVDFDLDGDIDIISSPPNGAMRVFENQKGGENAIQVELVDQRSHRSAIGARIILRDKKSQQMRELKVSGGFNSFDPLTQCLGSKEQVASLEIVWPDGEQQQIGTPLTAGSRYRITRK